LAGKSKAEGEGRRSNHDLVWKLISELHAKRFREADLQSQLVAMLSAAQTAATFSGESIVISSTK
jgi:hypothetical protein